MSTTIHYSDLDLEAARVASATPPPVAVARTPAPPECTPCPAAYVAPTVDDRALAPCPPHAPTTTPSIGVGVIVAGKYRIDAKLGEGATAVVWQARDLVLERDVALKTFAVRDVNGEAAQAVVQEAQATSDIGSDFIVPVHSACVDARLGIVAIDMKLCVERDANGQKHFGRDLSHYIPTAAPTRAQILDAARWVEEAAIGVQDAHANIVFHRDLKAANVLVSGVRRRAAVLDFGLARAHGIASSKRSTMAVTSARENRQLFHAGTPVNMAPEQARGLPRLDPANVDDDRRVLVAIDVYGLGSILYELLAGFAPHDYADDNTLWMTLARAQKNDVDFGVLAKRKVPGRLVAILRRALATNPWDRYASAAALADALRAFQENRPFAEEKSRFDVRALLAMRRHRGLVASIMMSLAVVGAAFGASTYELVQTRKATQAARAEISAAQAALVERQSHIDELQGNIQQLGLDQKKAEAEAADFAKLAGTATTEKEREEARAKLAEAQVRAKAAAAKKQAEENEQARLQSEIAHANAIAAVKGEHVAEVERMRQEHAAALARANKAHTDDVERLRATQAQELQGLAARQNAELAARDAAHRQAMAEREAASKQALAQREAALAQALADRDRDAARYKATLQAKDAEIARLREELAAKRAPVLQAQNVPPLVRR
ncbi:MAG: protein kinase [Deltaproteobacteria bacterium]|nr:protein kinase [Deltaproteobacteria bacterium]